MFGIVHFPFFVVAVLLLNVTPGPDTAYIIGRSVAQGRGAGLMSALGICTGCCVHSIACAFGLTALLAASATARGSMPSAATKTRATANSTNWMKVRRAVVRGGGGRPSLVSWASHRGPGWL